MDLEKSMMISAAGLRAQSTRMRIISENLANQTSVASTPDEDPYRRKMVSFKNVMDNELGISKIVIDKIVYDKTAFGSKYDPGHPAADDTGYVKTSNVRGMIETIDLQQAQRSYQANLNAVEASRNMLMQTLELLR